MTAPSSVSTAIDLRDLHRRAGQATRAKVSSIRSDQWSNPTNCDMDVRGLVNHLVSGHFWAVELLAGRTLAEVGPRLDSDLLGNDPLAAYDTALGAAVNAFDSPDALERVCHVSYGDLPGAVFCGHRILDTFIHGWDIARATGQDTHLDADLVEIVHTMFKPHEAELQAGGAFGTPVNVPADSDTQTRLLAMLGRDNRA